MPTNYYKAVVKGTLLGSVQSRNIFYGELTTNDVDTPTTLWNQYIDDFYSPLLTWMHSSWTLYAYDLYIWQNTEWVFLYTNPLSYSGGSGTMAIANSMAAVLIGKVAGGRAFGRKFLSGISSYNISGNAVTTAFLSILLGCAVVYVTPFNGLVFGRFVPGLWLKNNTFKPFITGFVSAFLGTMRRRKPGVGI